MKGAQQGLVEGQYDELLNFESADAFDERQKAALAYAEAIAWHMTTDDAFWERMHAHFSEPELVELGCVIGLTLGQQSWLRHAEHRPSRGHAGHRRLDGAGLRDARRARGSKAASDYWAKV